MRTGRIIWIAFLLLSPVTAAGQPAIMNTTPHVADAREQYLQAAALGDQGLRIKISFDKFEQIVFVPSCDFSSGFDSPFDSGSLLEQSQRNMTDYGKVLR